MRQMYIEKLNGPQYLDCVTLFVYRAQQLLLNTPFTKAYNPWREAERHNGDATNGNLIYTSTSYVVLC